MRLDAPAAEFLAIELWSPPRAGFWAATVVAAMTAVAIATRDSAEPVPVDVKHYLVVLRRDTGAELMRHDTQGNDANWVNHMQAELDRMTVGEFLAAWGIELS
jgi:hypothetical protein